MPHQVALITTIAIAFVLSAIFGYAADRLRLPALVGYLVAGVCIGPFTPGMVADVDLAAQLAEMGVILLMFGVGLHFSASDLLAVRGVAIPGAIGQILLATFLGTCVCIMWGWSVGEGIVFALSLSVASTVVLLKALEERNLLQTATGRAAIGWLIVEDLAMVLALVLLPAFAVELGGHPLDAGAHADSAPDSPILLTLAITLAKVGAFAALAVLIGPKIVPWILVQVARTGSRELFTLSVLAIAVGIAFGSAAAFGVSFALGAFFAGVIMGELHLSHRAAANSLPLQDAFSVLFFVSIGMLFDPTVLYHQPAKVLATLAIIVLGKSIIAFLIVLLLRYPIGMAIGVAASLSQIGEFSFILGALGTSYGLLSEEGRDLLVAGALLSITLNPLMLSIAAALQKWTQSRWPELYTNYGRGRSRLLHIDLDRNRARQEERERKQQQKITELLLKFPLFSQIDKHAQEELLLLFRVRSASPGERVIRRGERGNAMYFILAGEVEVHIGERVVPLQPGSFFGEMALLSGERRTADITAVDFCQFLVLERRDFNLFMARHPPLRAAVNAMAEQRRAMNQGDPREGKEADV